MIEIKQTENIGPPHPIRWLAFISWLVLPILATWIVVELTDLYLVWWGLVWFAFALAFMIMYFRWSRKHYPKP